MNLLQKLLLITKGTKVYEQDKQIKDLPHVAQVSDVRSKHIKVLSCKDWLVQFKKISDEYCTSSLSRRRAVLEKQQMMREDFCSRG